MIQSLLHLIQQKHSIYAFSKVTLLSYEMLGYIFGICQRVKKDNILLPRGGFNNIDSWMVQYEQERIKELQVTTSLDALNIGDFEEQVARLVNNNQNQPQGTPLQRYTLENRIQAFMPPPKPPTTGPTLTNEVVRSIQIAAEAYKKSVLKLRKKVLWLREEASINENYSSVVPSADDLLEQMEQLQGFFEDPGTVTKDRVIEFVRIYRLAIDGAYRSFSEHRGFLEHINPSLKNILGILAAMSIIVAIVVEAKSKHGFVGTFFRKHDTDSLDKLRAFREETEETMGALLNVM